MTVSIEKIRRNCFGNICLFVLFFTSLCSSNNYICELINPISGSVTFNAVAFINNKFILCGDSGVIMTSPDGNIWTRQNSGTKNTLNSIASIDTKVVVVGKSGTIVTSSNGSDWDVALCDTTKDIFSITSGNNLFVAVGGKYDGYANVSNGFILSSTDAKVWKMVDSTTGLSVAARSVAFGDNKFVAVGPSQVLSSTNGTVWSEELSKFHRGKYIAYANNRYMVICDTSYNADSKHFIMTSKVVFSRDSTISTDTIIDDDRRFYSVTYGDSTYVCVGDYVTPYTSENETTWTLRYSGNPNTQLKSVVYGNGKFVAVGDNSTVLVLKGENNSAILNTTKSQGISRIKIAIINNQIVCTIPCKKDQNQPKVEIFNYAGKKVHCAVPDIENDLFRISVSEFTKGAYLLRIKNGDYDLFSPIVLSK